MNYEEEDIENMSESDIFDLIEAISYATARTTGSTEEAVNLVWNIVGLQNKQELEAEIVKEQLRSELERKITKWVTWMKGGFTFRNTQ